MPTVGKGVREGLDEMGIIRKTTLTVGGEKIEKLTVEPPANSSIFLIF